MLRLKNSACHKKKHFIMCLICSRQIIYAYNVKKHLRAFHKTFLNLRAELEKITFEKSLFKTYNNHFMENSFPNHILIQSEIKDFFPQSQSFSMTISKNNNESQNIDGPKLPYLADDSTVIEEESRKPCSPQHGFENFGALIENDPIECVTIATGHAQTPIISMKHREELKTSLSSKGLDKYFSYLTCKACKAIRTVSIHYSNILNKHYSRYIKDYCCCKEKNKCCCQYSKSVLNFNTNQTSQSNELYKIFFSLISSTGNKKWFCSICYKYSNVKRKGQDWHSNGFEYLNKNRLHNGMQRHLSSKIHKISIMHSKEKKKLKIKSKSRASPVDIRMMVEHFFDHNVPKNPYLKLIPKMKKSKPNGSSRNIKQCHCCDSIQKLIELYLIMQATIIERIENYIHEMCICSDEQFCCCMPKLKEFISKYSSINTDSSKDATITACVSNSSIEDNFFYYYKDYPPKKYYVCSLCNSLPEILSVWSSEGFLFTNKNQLIKEMKNHLKSGEHIETMKISMNTNTTGEEVDSLLAKKRKKAYEIYQCGLKNEESNFIQAQAGLNGSNDNFKTIKDFNVNKKKTNKPTGNIKLHVKSESDNVKKKSYKVKKKSRLTASILENKAMHEVHSRVRPESSVDIHVEPTFRSESSGSRPTYLVENCESYISTQALARSSCSIEYRETPPINPVQMTSSCRLLNKGLQIVEGDSDISKCEFSVANYISSENRKKRKWLMEKPNKVSNISLTNSEKEGAGQILPSSAIYFTEDVKEFDISLKKGNPTKNFKEKQLVLVKNFSTLTNPSNENTNYEVIDIKEEAENIKEEVIDIKEEAENIKEEETLFSKNDFANEDISSSDYTGVNFDPNDFSYVKRKCSVENVTGMPMPIMEKSNLLANIHNNSIVGKYTSTTDNYSTDTNEIIMNKKFSKIKSESNSNSNDDKISQINIESSFDTVSKRTGTGENLYTVKLIENSGDDSNISVFKPAENSKKIRLKKYRINSFKTSSTFPAVCDENLNSSGELPSAEFSQRLNENEEDQLKYIVKEEDMADE